MNGEIKHDIDDKMIDEILEDSLMGEDKFGMALNQLDDVFLETLTDLDNKGNSTENLEIRIFGTKEEAIISDISQNLEGVDEGFDTFSVDPLPLKVSNYLTKELQMESINCYSNILQPTFLELKNTSEETKSNKLNAYLPMSSTYRDLSMMADEQVDLKFKSMVGRSQEPFPVKLHKVIDQIEIDGMSSIISWSPHGRAFKIHNKSLFVKRVMSRYFYQTKMYSFTRQLGMYGFRKLIGEKNPDKGAYFHELFLRGRLGLSRGIPRLTRSSLLDPNNEPNLNLFPPMPRNHSWLQSLNSSNQDVEDDNRVENLLHGKYPRTVHYCTVPDIPPMNMGPIDDSTDGHHSSSMSSKMLLQEGMQSNVINLQLLEKMDHNQKEALRSHFAEDPMSLEVLSVFETENALVLVYPSQVPANSMHSYQGPKPWAIVGSYHCNITTSS